MYAVGSSFIKSELYSWLRLEKDADGNPPPCYCHFPQYDEHYFRGLTAEEQLKKIVRGYPHYEWVKTYERNEPLDCRNYARAAASIVGLDRLKPEVIEKMSGMKTKLSRETTEISSNNYSSIQRYTNSIQLINDFPNCRGNTARRAIK